MWSWSKGQTFVDVQVKHVNDRLENVAIPRYHGDRRLERINAVQRFFFLCLIMIIFSMSGEC